GSPNSRRPATIGSSRPPGDVVQPARLQTRRRTARVRSEDIVRTLSDPTPTEQRAPVRSLSVAEEKLSATALPQREFAGASSPKGTDKRMFVRPSVTGAGHQVAAGPR